MGLGSTEIVLILFVVLLLFGGKKIPELAKGLGSGIKNFKKAINEDDEVAEVKKVDEIEKKLKQNQLKKQKQNTYKSSILQDLVKKHIEEVLQTKIVLEKPKDISLGHFATPIAFSLAKELKKSPMVIAEEIVSKFSSSSMFEKVEAVKGFVNFKLSSKFLDSLVNNALKNRDTFAKEDKKNETILLEYVSANPTGPLHIGHARGAIAGDSLARVGKYLGYDITTEYYINDAGAQMDLLGLSVSLAARDFLFNEEVVYPETYYRGEYLIDIAKQV